MKRYEYFVNLGLNTEEIETKFMDECRKHKDCSSCQYHDKNVHCPITWLWEEVESKTYLDLLTEAFPNYKKMMCNGLPTPSFCPSDLGLKNGNCLSEEDCNKCWRQIVK